MLSPAREAQMSLSFRPKSGDPDGVEESLAFNKINYNSRDSSTSLRYGRDDIVCILNFFNL